MSKRLLANIVLTCMATVFLSTTHLIAAQMCQQTIELVGNTNEDTSKLCFYEYVSGGCSYYKLYELTISPESLLSAKHWMQDNLTLPLWGDSIKSRIELEVAERLSEDSGKFGLYYGQYLLSNPTTNMSENKIAADSVLRLAGSVPDRVQDPDFSIDVELLYRMPGGLYLDYDIHEVYIFRKSRIFFIVTRQPKGISANETLNGVLIYRFKQNF